MKLKLSILFSLLACCMRCLGDNVFFAITNGTTGLPDTNVFYLQQVYGLAMADGSYQTKGLPVPFIATNGYGIWSNMPAGIWRASGRTLTPEYIGDGLPGTPDGIYFHVYNYSVTNTYPFTRFPASGGDGGLNAFNQYAGIVGVNGTNGIAATYNNGTVTLDGSGISSNPTAAGVTNSLGYIPANTNQTISVFQTTNSATPFTLAFPFIFFSVDTNGAGQWWSQQSGQGVTNFVTAGNNSITNDINANAATAAAATALVQGNLTSTGNNLTNVAAAVLNYGIGVSNTDYGRAFNISNTAAANLASSGTSITNLAVAYSQSATNQANKAAHDATNVFLGWLGSLAFLNGINSNNVSGQINPSQIYPAISSGGTASSNTFSGQLNFSQIFPLPDTNGAGAWANITAFNSSSNLTFTLGQSGSNFVYLVGNNGTNWGLGIGQNDTNFAFVVSNSVRGFALTIGANDTNWTSQNSNSLLLTIQTYGTGATNWGFVVSNSLNAQLLAIGTGATNWGNQISNNFVVRIANFWDTNKASAFPNIEAPSETLTNLELASGTVVASGAIASGADITAAGEFDGSLNLNAGKLKDSIGGIGAAGYMLGNFGSAQAMWTNPAVYLGPLFDSSGQATAAFLGASNMVGVAGVNSTNYANIIGSNGTNYGNWIGLNSTNYGNTIGSQGTNYGNVIGGNSTNYANLAISNGPTTWNAVHKGVTFLGGNPWSVETIAVLRATNWSGNDIGANGTYIAQSINAWLNTNNPVWAISSNGAGFVWTSNQITVATANNSLVCTLVPPGAGNTPGLTIGQNQDENGISHIGQANFQHIASPDGNFLNLNASNINANTFAIGNLAGTAAGLTNFGPLVTGETNMSNPSWIPWRASQVDTFNNIGKSAFPNTIANIRAGKTFTVELDGTGFMGGWLAGYLATNFFFNFPFAGANFPITYPPAPQGAYNITVNLNALTNAVTIGNNSGGTWPSGSYMITNTGSQSASSYVFFTDYPWNQIKIPASVNGTGAAFLVWTNTSTAGTAWTQAGSFTTASAGAYGTNFTLTFPITTVYSVNGAYEVMFTQTAAGTNWFLSVPTFINTAISNGVVLVNNAIGSSGHFESYLNASNYIVSPIYQQINPQLYLWQDIDSSNEWQTNGPLWFGFLKTNNPNMDICVANTPANTDTGTGDNGDTLTQNSAVLSNAVTLGFSMFDVNTALESTNNILLRGWESPNVNFGWPHISADVYNSGWNGFSAWAYMWYRWLGLGNFYYSGPGNNFIDFLDPSVAFASGGTVGGAYGFAPASYAGQVWGTEIVPSGNTYFWNLGTILSKVRAFGLTNMTFYVDVYSTNNVTFTIPGFYSITLSTNNASVPGGSGQYLRNSGVGQLISCTSSNVTEVSYNLTYPYGIATNLTSGTIGISSTLSATNFWVTGIRVEVH